MTQEQDIAALQPEGGVVPGIKVFVYGTLKKDHSNHYLLLDTNSTFLGRCFLEGNFSMRSLTFYPCVVQTDTAVPKQKIFGEVYQISEETLDALDLLEGNGRYFTRHKVVTPWKNAWMYFLPNSYILTTPQVDAGMWHPTQAELDYWAGKKVA